MLSGHRTASRSARSHAKPPNLPSWEAALTMNLLVSDLFIIILTRRDSQTQAPADVPRVPIVVPVTVRPITSCCCVGLW
jgi:hypothetical protein